jgi:hypothetical protein
MDMISIAKLMRRTARRGSCRVWTGNINKRTGYGSVWADGRTRQVHVVSFEAHHGPVPDGKCVLHSCDVRSCIEGSHLSAGTRKENTQDMFSKGRARKARGQSHGLAKLTQAQAEEIRLRYRPYDRSNSSCALAREYQVTQSTVWAVLCGQTWTQ